VFLNTSFHEDEARNHINLGLLCEQFWSRNYTIFVLPKLVYM